MEVDLKQFSILDAEELEEVTGATTKMIAFGVSTYKPGFGGPAQHIHAGEGEESEEIYFVLKGTGVLYAGKDKREVRMKPGMWIYIPANCYHGLMNDGDEDLVMVILMAPTPVRLLKRAGIVK